MKTFIRNTCFVLFVAATFTGHLHSTQSAVRSAVLNSFELRGVVTNTGLLGNGTRAACVSMK